VTARVRTPSPPKPVIPEVTPQPAPDPVAVDKPVASPAPARRIVGLSFESTVSGGPGPAFAVGNTRMGRTADTAVAADSVQPAAPTFTPAVRRNVLSPDYPPALRTRGIQGEVGLSVEIDAEGAVQGVEIVAPSEFDDFNRAAVAAARKTTYEPARVNGVPVSNVIRFTVRFRLHE
jgi:protein TonB